MTEDRQSRSPTEAGPNEAEVRPQAPGGFDGPKGDPAEGKPAAVLADQGDIAADDAGATAAAQRAQAAARPPRNEDDVG